MNKPVEFTVAEALEIADANSDAYKDVASVSRVLAAEVRRLQDLERFLVDGLVVANILKDEHTTDLKGALNALIDWHVGVALDPAVSSQAAELRDMIPKRVQGWLDDHYQYLQAREQTEPLLKLRTLIYQDRSAIGHYSYHVKTFKEPTE